MSFSNICKTINELVSYGINTGFLPKEERIYTINLLLHLLKLDEYTAGESIKETRQLHEILSDLCDYAFENGLINDNGVTARDIFDTQLMNALMPRPIQVINTFNALLKEDAKKATDYFYKLSCDSNYIRRDRIKKDIKWVTKTKYGDIDITINLSKPEKDPKAIAAMLKNRSASYPLCQLCMENEGYAGRLDHPARANHRIIPISILGKKWGFQYSPYVYFNEHCIVFSGEHTPMKINHEAFCKLFDFVSQFPHYCLGSNADLPIVGGSILTHDHFQGGNYEFPMTRAEIKESFLIKGYEDVEAGILNWPMSVIRLKSESAQRLIELSDRILDLWRKYTDEDAYIYACTDGECHNTITPIVRKRDGRFEIDLALRNNITTKECPLGLYHPHDKLHHIKKENIGLIEVMGLAILPARLKDELNLLKEAILNGNNLRENDILSKHADWVDEFLPEYSDINKENIDDIIKEEVGKIFCQVLEDAGVYKCDENGLKAFRKFIDKI